jgi:hypothetical protein
MTPFGKMMLRSGLAAAVLALSAVQAQAATLVFTLTGAYSAVWQLDSNPVPSLVLPGGFRVASVAGTFGGTAQSVTIDFFAPSSSGGLIISAGGPNLANLVGPQLFTGTTSAPTFRTGTFALSNEFTGAPASINITPLSPSAAVPEPATWATMLAGFAAMGAALRKSDGRRRQRPALRLRFA